MIDIGQPAAEGVALADADRQAGEVEQRAEVAVEWAQEVSPWVMQRPESGVIVLSANDQYNFNEIVAFSDNDLNIQSI
ncbi:hypothetical protein HPA02_35340 [Bisbaumannia pacifica]|uniref:Uncharacterized protein n=1 Tax=Bisbaumannia pacifica TaxID=77098 RepID=A0A510XDW9_9GAMM|nr:hypothetical protein HPA02_35340 [Halomonas pacifica]